VVLAGVLDAVDDGLEDARVLDAREPAVVARVAEELGVALPGVRLQLVLEEAVPVRGEAGWLLLEFE